MIPFFQPRYLKDATLLARNARKLLHRQRDLLSEAEHGEYAASIAELETVTRNGTAKDRLQVEQAAERLDRKFGKLHPPRADAGWRENCEVLLVAFVLAIGLRAYFIQPFKIPTGSMEPTLNGITAHIIPLNQPLPGFFGRTVGSLWAGRTYVEAISAVDDRLVQLQAVKRFGFLSYTRIVCASGHEYLVHVPIETLVHPVGADGFGLSRGREFPAGQAIVRGYVATGDKVFVDKFTYHFRRPKRADVFVFSTSGIADIHITEPNVTSEFYIKRIGGATGDTLRIDAPNLYVNGGLAEDAPLERVMRGQAEGYRGYGNIPMFQYLTTPAESYTVPPKSYFALGDNSYNSSDSRVWGCVPAENVVGRGLFVYWPFGAHWGFIR